MNLQFYLEKLYASEEFKGFTKENPDAFLCSGFFVIDKSGNDNKVHFDFYVGGKMFSFQLEDSIKLVPIEMINKEVPEKLLSDCDFDFEDIEKMIVEKMAEQEVKSKIQKILLSLQKVEGKIFLVGTVFISGLGMLKINIDLSEKKIVLFEKKSILDIVRKVK